MEKARLSKYTGLFRVPGLFLQLFRGMDHLLFFFSTGCISLKGLPGHDLDAVYHAGHRVAYRVDCRAPDLVGRLDGPRCRGRRGFLGGKTDMADAMRQAGAVAYLEKSGPVAELVSAIRSCLPLPMRCPG